MEEKKYIQSLLDKFLEGNTTETEERLLSDYFSSDNDIPTEWQEYVIFFRGFKNYKPVAAHSNSHKRIWLSAAASIAILIGIGITLYPKMDSETIETSKEPTIAKVERPVVHQPIRINEAKTDIKPSKPKSSVKVPRVQTVQQVNTPVEEHTENTIYESSAPEFDDYSTDGFICINLDKMKHENNEVRSAMASMNNELLSLE